MHIHFLRHATLVLTYHNVNLLIDPMLSPAGALDPVANAADQRRIPLVDLPVSDSELRQLIEQSDAVLVTHTHRDHWDANAVELIPKDKPILCQPDSETAIREAGFTAVTPIVYRYEWRGITFHRTDGQHGTGEIGQKMGIVSGFVLQAPGEPILYIAGDTIWCDEVQKALDTYHPDIVIVNAGAAQFLTGDPITMTAADVAQVCRAAHSATVVAVHMETVNHCGLTRAALRAYLEGEGLANGVIIPVDGAHVPIHDKRSTATITQQQTLAAQLRSIPPMFHSPVVRLDDTALRQRPAANDWSAIEVLGHIIDKMRLWASCVERIAREDNPMLPVYDQDAQVRAHNYQQADPQALLRQLEQACEYFAQLVERTPDEALTLMGTHEEMGAMPLTRFVETPIQSVSDHLVQFRRAAGLDKG